jgi:hypothetical protein
MDEKKIRTTGGDVYDKLHKNRKTFFNSKRDTWLSGYIQGALDQDPISRKKRTEEVITIILNTHTKLINDFPNEKYTSYVEGLINKMLAEVQALP